MQRDLNPCQTPRMVLQGVDSYISLVSNLIGTFTPSLPCSSHWVHLSSSPPLLTAIAATFLAFTSLLGLLHTISACLETSHSSAFVIGISGHALSPLLGFKLLEVRNFCSQIFFEHVPRVRHCSRPGEKLRKEAYFMFSFPGVYILAYSFLLLIEV